MVSENREAIDDRIIPGRPCLVISNELRYSDGRDVAKTFFLDDGGSVRWVWRLGPSHPSNQAGYVAAVENGHGVTNRKFVVAMPGVIEMLEDHR